MSNIDQVEGLENDNIDLLLLKYSLPAIIGFIALALYEITDRIFVGQVVGSSGLAAIAVGMPVVITLNALCIMFRSGIASVLSRTLGSKDYSKVDTFITSILCFAATLGLLVAGFIGYFAYDIADLCAAPVSLLDWAGGYILLIGVGAVGLFVGNAASVVIRALGHPRISMALIVGSTALNVLLDAYFIIYMDYGVIGAAWGTMLAQTAGGVCGVFLLRAHIVFKADPIDFGAIKQCVLLGLPLFSFEIHAVICVLIVNNLLEIYGTTTDLACVPIFTSILSFLFMPIVGVDEGAQVLIGYNYAAGKLQRVRKIIFRTLMIAVLFFSFSFVIVQCFAEYIILIFDASNPEFVTHAARVCRIILSVAPLMAFMYTIPGILTALGDVRYSFFLSVVLEIFAQYTPLFILPLFWGLDGVFAAFPVCDVIFAIAASVCLYLVLKRESIL